MGLKSVLLEWIGTTTQDTLSCMLFMSWIKTAGETIPSLCSTAFNPGTFSEKAMNGEIKFFVVFTWFLSPSLVADSVSILK